MGSGSGEFWFWSEESVMMSACMVYGCVESFECGHVYLCRCKYGKEMFVFWCSRELIPRSK